MKQYKITYTVDKGEGDNCVLDPSDPIHKMKEGMFLGSVPGLDVYEVYPEVVGEEDRKINPYGQH
jgi:hypothetical protein